MAEWESVEQRRREAQLRARVTVPRETQPPVTVPRGVRKHVRRTGRRAVELRRQRAKSTGLGPREIRFVDPPRRFDAIVANDDFQLAETRIVRPCGIRGRERNGGSCGGDD